MKTCCTCKVSKDLSQFHRCKTLPDGLYKVCKACRVDSSREHRERHGDKIRASWRENYKKDPQKHRANVRHWQKENWDYVKAYRRDWGKNNLEKTRKHSAKRTASLKEATPPWLTKEQKKEMRWFYETARELQWLSEEPLHVDHIAPLHGENFRGLHVPWNLQIISAKQNIAKGNSLEPAR